MQSPSHRNCCAFLIHSVAGINNVECGVLPTQLVPSDIHIRVSEWASLSTNPARRSVPLAVAAFPYGELETCSRPLQVMTPSS